MNVTLGEPDPGYGGTDTPGCGAMSRPVNPPKLTTRFLCSRDLGHEDELHVASASLGRRTGVVAVASWRGITRPEVLSQDKLHRLALQ